MRKIGKYTPEEMKIVEPQLAYSERRAMIYNERAKTETIYWHDIKPRLVRSFDTYVGWGCRLDCFNSREAYDTWIQHLMKLTPNTK